MHGPRNRLFEVSYVLFDHITCIELLIEYVLKNNKLLQYMFVCLFPWQCSFVGFPSRNNKFRLNFEEGENTIVLKCVVTENNMEASIAITPAIN